jgi:hypothetical protein
MREKGYFTLFIAAAAIGWVTFGLILLNVDPFTAVWYEFLFFYFSLTLALIATFFIIGWTIRSWIIKRYRLHEGFGVMWRQSLFLTLLVVTLLLLQSVRVLAWWNMLIFVIALILFEVFFILNSKKR